MKMKITYMLLGMFCLIPLGKGRPMYELEDWEDDENQQHDSYVRVVRSTPDKYKHYEDEDDGVIGYSNKKDGGGSKGYKKYDAYHKKGGDNYEFEKADSYGHDDDEKANYEDKEHDNEHDDEGNFEVERVKSVKGNKKKQKKQPAKYTYSEGNNDGNGGEEAYGHDPEDYVLPESYTYGEGDEYNFR